MSGIVLFVRVAGAITDEVVTLEIDATTSDVCSALGRHGRLYFQGREVEGSLADLGVCSESCVEFFPQCPWDLGRARDGWNDELVVLRHASLGTVLYLDRFMPYSYMPCSHMTDRWHFTFHETGETAAEDAEYEVLLLRKPLVGDAVDHLFWREGDWPAEPMADEAYDVYFDMWEEPFARPLHECLEKEGSLELGGLWRAEDFQGGVLLSQVPRPTHCWIGGRWRALDSPPDVALWLREQGFICMQRVGEAFCFERFQAWEVRDGQVRRLDAAEASRINDMLAANGHRAFAGTATGTAGREEMGRMKPMWNYAEDMHENMRQEDYYCYYCSDDECQYDYRCPEKGSAEKTQRRRKKDKGKKNQVWVRGDRSLW